jgi:hypothetical protein
LLREFALTSTSEGVIALRLIWTDSSAPYNYNALFIGIIILSFGVGSIIGSFVGGKWSDVTLRRLKKANGGVTIPEVSTGSCVFKGVWGPARRPD